MRIPVVVNLVLLFIAGCSESQVTKLNSEVSDPAKPQDAAHPLLKGHIRLHDPSGIVEDQGYLMTFATGGQIRMSYLPPGDHQWVAGKSVFQADEKPAWIEDYVPDNKGFWAPHAPFPCVLYYSVADDSDGKDIACIGRATALGEPPDQVWIDDGKPVLVCDRDVDTEPFAIDPAIFEGEGNTLWMVYGSHWSGIWVIELDPDTGHIKDGKACERGWTEDNSAFHHVASNLDSLTDEVLAEGFVAGRIEAPYVFRRNGYYYLFVNWGICCHGVESTYEIRVGRSRSPYGPYIDKTGRDMAKGGGTLFVESKGRFIGPGHAGIYTYVDSLGQTRHVFTYHFYDGDDDGRSKLNARELIWDDHAWPVLTDRVFYGKQ
jgi:arabinan endo-1,5-alpha-L-arabinosidase